MKKVNIQLDRRIITLIENGAKSRHRSMFVIIGDKSIDQILNLHHILSKSVVKSSPEVLWCYKYKLELSSHQKKMTKQMKKLTRQGLLDPEKANRLALFLETAKITRCFYRDSERVLGGTYDMCILQDFEALTPNLLARTIETVEGGGLIVLLLRSLSSLTSLYTMVMDVHDRFRTESHSHASGRFNERLLLSLASCKACIVMDDELNILPISSHVKSFNQVPAREDTGGLSKAERELKNLKEQFNDDFPMGPLIRKCCTMDQGKAVVTFIDAILAKSLRSTVALLAGRGRGKSAALGLAISGAVAAGYSNICVTAPSPENLKTLFHFICQGFDMLGYKNHLDYDLVQSTNPDFKKALVRINIFKKHRQTIQYIQPHEHEKLSQVELLVIDEAAAIPLPVVKSMLGPYLVFLSSTVNGYEGTGRSLSLKLVQQLEKQNQTSIRTTKTAISGRFFKKIELSESIRYASNDPIESWLHGLLCLDVTNSMPSINRLPPPSECNLYYVNRDTLFSYHKDSELFLQRMMALYVASHYKNSPNDLQLMADAPAHHLFALLGPVDESNNHLPDILCVIQISFEGEISRKSVIKSLKDGHQPYGDQIPWKFCEQFLEETSFPSLAGARIVRIATRPDAMKLGYGSAAVELLTRYFEGELTPISQQDLEEPAENSPANIIQAAEKASLLEENIKPRTDLPPLLVPLRERRPEKLHYLGVSFGLTLDLFRFWRKHNFAPFYISEVPSNVTGEHTCMVLKPLKNDDFESAGSDQLDFSPFYQMFRKNLTESLGDAFRSMEYNLAMSVLDPKINFSDVYSPPPSSSSEYLNSISETLSMEHLEAYTNNLAPYHVTGTFIAALARSYFWEKIPVTLSYAQASVLLCIGLQDKDIPYIEGEMKLERQEIMALYMEVMKKLYKYLNDIASNGIHPTSSRLKDIGLELEPLDEDLNDAAKQAQDNVNAKADFEKALQKCSGKVAPGSVKSSRTKIEKQKEEKSEKKRHKHRDHSCKSNKKRKS